IEDLATGYAFDADTIAVSAEGSALALAVDGAAVGDAFVSDKLVGVLFSPNDGLGNIDVVSVEPDTVSESYVGGVHSAMADGGLVGEMVVDGRLSSAEIYRRWHLFEPDRVTLTEVGGFGSVVGEAVVGLEAYQALLRIEATFVGDPNAFVVGQSCVDHGFVLAGSDTIDRVHAALRAASVGRDDIEYTTQTHRQMRISDLTFQKPVPFGAMVPIEGAST
ncbi:MAG: hypothetical protein AAF141_02800, partial [Pseudomonadota bacterium]